MDGRELEDHYRAYLRALDERRFADLDRFVAGELVHNGRPMTRQDHAGMIAADVAAAPDLRYGVGTLVVAGDRVAARLLFGCTPTGVFLGLAPTGRRVVFTEHVFHRFDDGRIADVRSLVDRPAVERQLAG